MSYCLPVLPNITSNNQRQLLHFSCALGANILILLSIGLSSMAQAAQPISIATDIPYKDPAEIQGNIIQECTDLGQKLSQFIEIYAEKQNLKIKRVTSIDADSGTPTAIIHITEAVSMGNAFIGHQKYMAAKVEYWNAGKMVTLRHFQRPSMGGFGAGFKGSCTVLGRITKALGKDIAEYLNTLSTSQ